MTSDFRSKGKQGTLFPTLRTQMLRRRRDFDALFEGFAKMRAITYVASPDLLLEFFDQRGYEKIEVLVGENLSDSYRNELEQKGIEVTERLAEHVENGTLRIFVPDKTIHTKLYILEGQGLTRVIQSSANLTETARSGRQINYAWCADLPTEDSLLQQVLKDYQSHLEGCSLFMGDLKELLSQREGLSRREVIETWLKGVDREEAPLEIRRLLQEVNVNTLQGPDSKKEPIFSVRLPESAASRKKAEQLLKPLNPTVTSGGVLINSRDYINYTQKTLRFLPMYVDMDHREVRLGINGSVCKLTGDPPDSASLNNALELIEKYINTVDWGQSSDPKFAKMSMFEALLYVFFTPFAHEYMKSRMEKFGAIERRGPRFLYIYGPAQNGKTTFLRFALKLLTEHAIDPLPGTDFTKSKIFNAITHCSAFPLIFDDVRAPIETYQEVIKPYWEVQWNAEFVSPQIIISSNKLLMQDWAKSRVKRVDFDVHFARNEQNVEKLNQLFSYDNPIFKWFSYLYLQLLDNKESPRDDEIHLARIVMKQLYERAQRPLPEFFPEEPLEKLYDPGRRDWRDLLEIDKKARFSRYAKNKGRVDFTEDMQHYEIKYYEDSLPQTIKYKRKGKSVFIENPDDFKVWLKEQIPKKRTPLTALRKAVFRR